MVIGHDPFSNDRNTSFDKKTIKELNPAPRLDRIAAAIVDATITITFAKVFAAKAIYALRVSASFNLDKSLFASAFNLLWLTFSVYLIYIILTHRSLGRTIGQTLFSTKTVLLNNNRYLDQYTLVLRTLLAYVSVFMVFPVLSILFNKDGRTFYDKICDTIVLTTKKNARRENTYIPFDKLIGSSLVLVIFIFFSYSSLYFTKNIFKFKSDFVKNSKVCKELTDFHQSWLESRFEESRIQVALALYSSGELSANCLSKEIDLELNIDADSATAYFAKGLINIDTDKKFIRYFNKSCEIDPRSSACLVSTWMSFWPNNLEGEDEDFSFVNQPMFVKVWSIKRNHQKGNLYKLSKILNEMKVPPGLEGFYAEHLLRAEHFLGHSNKFENVLKIAENRNLRTRKLDELYCSVAVAENCSAFKELSSCRSLTIDRSSDPYLQNMFYACQGVTKRIFSSEREHERYYLRLAKNEPQVLDELKSVFMNSENSFVIRYSSLNSFFNQVTNIDYLQSIKNDWESKTDKDLIWRLTGEKLKDKFIANNDLQLSFQVYKKLSSEFKEIQNKVDFLENYQKIRHPAQNVISNVKSKGQ